MEVVRTWMCLRDLRRNVTRSPEHLRSLQDTLFRSAVLHAYHHIPFYRRAWDEAGVDIDAVQKMEDVVRLPIIGAPRMREAAKEGELLAREIDPGSCTYLDTSGSSGTPLRIWKRPLEERIRRAVGLRIWFDHGFHWRHHTAQFQIKPGPSHPLQRAGISGKTWISSIDPLQDQVARLVESRADVVVGTATALRRIAQACEASQSALKRPVVVFCAGELIDGETREWVTRIFGREPVGIYGQTEVGYVAWQCERRNAFHISADTHYVEIVREGQPVQPGELGTIVVTDLRGRTMPLLRYNTADLAVAATGACPCGRHLPVIGSIEGRERAAVILEGGRLLTSRTIINHLVGVLRLGEYRLRQESLNRFTLELTGRAVEDHRGGNRTNPESPGYHAVLSHLRQLLGEVEIMVKPVEPWPADGTGKTHAIFSPLSEYTFRTASGTVS